MKRKYKMISGTILLVAILIAMIDMLFGLITFREGSAYLSVRRFIQSEDHEPGYIPQPFLNYINNPHYRSENGQHQINDLGIRHPSHVAVPKPAKTLRVLCLGGSTTFGEVDRTEDAFPAVLQSRLKDSLTVYGQAYSRLECINTGMGAATSAEVMIHYLLQYKYLDADIVIIHMGINDAFATPRLPGYVYQPDYHTSKKIMENTVMPGSVMRLLSHSNIACYLMANMYWKSHLQSNYTSNPFFEYHNRDLWLPEGNDSIFNPRYNAFYNNLKELIRSSKEGGKKVLLVTEVLEESKMPKQLKEMLWEGAEQNRSFMIRAGEEMGVHVCVLDKKDFTASYFQNDGIHLTVQGEQLVAEKIAPYLADMIKEIK